MINLDLINKHTSRQDPDHNLQKMLLAIRKCGVTFRVSKKKFHKCHLNSEYYRYGRQRKAQVEGQRTHEWTSLRGNDRKTLLRFLPPSIPDLLPNNNGIKIKLWKVHVINNYHTKKWEIWETFFPHFYQLHSTKMPILKLYIEAMYKLFPLTVYTGLPFYNGNDRQT